LDSQRRVQSEKRRGERVLAHLRHGEANLVKCLLFSLIKERKSVYVTLFTWIEFFCLKGKKEKSHHNFLPTATTRVAFFTIPGKQLFFPIYEENEVVAKGRIILSPGRIIVSETCPSLLSIYLRYQYQPSP